MNIAKRTASAALLTVALAFAGCATAVDARSATSSSPSTTAPTDPSSAPSPLPSSPPTSAPTSAAGAYVDFSDGAIETTAGPKALFFHAAWCPQCRTLDEDLRANGAPDGLTVFKVDYDARADLRQKYGVTLQTTVVFVDDAGELISSSVLYDDPSVASLAAAIP